MNDMCKPTDVGGVLTWEHMADTWRNVLPSCPLALRNPCSSACVLLYTCVHVRMTTGEEGKRRESLRWIHVRRISISCMSRYVMVWRSLATTTIELITTRVLRESNRELNPVLAMREK